MSRILWKKLIGLGRDEDGAALIITLALFMFLYVSCAGVYAIGQSVKNRIHLQNACDAAAYSAAIVQADTLSRIATINRAMSWTYVSMTRRQMDYIVYKWLDHSLQHYDLDRQCAKKWYDGVPGGHTMSKIYLNGHSGAEDTGYSEDDIRKALNSFVDKHLQTRENRQSFYIKPDLTKIALSDLKDQIREDKNTITAMETAERILVDGDRERSIPSLEDRILQTIRKMSVRNIPVPDGCYFSILKPKVGVSSYGYSTFKCFKVPDGRFLTVNNTAKGEKRLLQWSVGWHEEGFDSTYPDDPDASYVRSVFDKGIDNWFVRQIEGGVGIHRNYRQNEPAKPLYATWCWSTWREDPVTGVRDYRAAHVECQECDHVYKRCWCESNTYFDLKEYKVEQADKPRTPKPSVAMKDGYSAISYADTVYDDYYNGGYVRPMLLKEDYFGSAGTITVGLAKYNENPFLGILRNSPGVRDWGDKGFGILGAFNPFRYVEWSWAFSSAKAGYDDAGDDSRAYKVGWKDGLWNLSTSDWDAVFVPVRKACAMADSKWNSAGSDFLKDWVENSDRWEALGDGSTPPPCDVVGKMPSLPAMHSNVGAIRDLKWERMTELMFH